jgi:hypothetical protein
LSISIIYVKILAIGNLPVKLAFRKGVARLADLKMVQSVDFDDAAKMVKAVIVAVKGKSGYVCVLGRDGQPDAPLVVQGFGSPVKANFDDAVDTASEVVKTGHSIPDADNQESAGNEMTAAFRLFVGEDRDPEGWVGVISICSDINFDESNKICSDAAASVDLFIDVD